jgi:Fe-S-cluster containining protein
MFSETDSLTRDNLEKYWDEVLATHGRLRAIGVNLTAPLSSPGTASLMAFMPLYLVATFLKCQQCSSCCRPNERKWDKGIVLSREEARSLKQFAKITKKNGQRLLKYPCPLLEDDNCTQYMKRPYGCRLFPFTPIVDKAANQFSQGIIMTCPASRDFYVTVQLFLQRWHTFLEDCRRSGKRGFETQDLERLKLDFDYNQVDAEELSYMKKMANNPPLPAAG